MSVFTVVTEAQLSAFLSRFAVGNLIRFSGIESGVENTNYFVDTDAGRYVLTLFEILKAKQASSYLELTQLLFERGVPCPAPVLNKHGDLIAKLNDRPTALVQRLPGSTLNEADAAHCWQVGRALAEMHLALADYRAPTEAPRGRTWQQAALPKLAGEMHNNDKTQLAHFLTGPDIYTQTNLPTGTIHSDLFGDNVLFEGDQIKGLIDFYSAHSGPLIYDLAVCTLDWCHDSAHTFKPELAQSMRDGYSEIRPLELSERQAWQLALKSAAARFWISRLYDRRFPRAGSIITTKDPARFHQIFQCLGDLNHPLVALMA